MLHGLLNVHKPRGITSRQAVNCVQRKVRPAKVGHAGTLDPLASGVLVVGVGSATRLVRYVQQMTKRYRATFLLGRHSPTEDVEGEVVLLDNPPVPADEEIRRAAATLTGEILQRPPAYSALKVRGRRAYKLARAGQSVELSPRRITIHRLEIVSYAYPRLTVDVDCGSGTYIRSLGRDLAESLGTAAVMSELVRIAIGGFHLEQAVTLDEFASGGVEEHLLPLLHAVGMLPRVTLSNHELAAVRNGRMIDRRGLPPAEEYAAVDQPGRLVAILRPRDRGQLGPVCNLQTS